MGKYTPQGLQKAVQGGEIQSSQDHRHNNQKQPQGREALLLSKYAGRAYTHYALLAGYTEIGETLEQTVHREVMEEVGLQVKNLRYYKSQPWGVDGNVLMGFFCDVDGSNAIHIDENELSMAAWYPRDALPARDDGISLTREMIRIFEEGKEPK